MYTFKNIITEAVLGFKTKVEAAKYFKLPYTTFDSLIRRSTNSKITVNNIHYKFDKITKK